MPKSLHSVAQRANTHLHVEHAGVPTWTAAICSKLPSPKGLVAFIADSGILTVKNVKKWLRGFTAAGEAEAERIEQDWQDAVKKAHATHAFHEHMDVLKASRASYDQATGSAVSSATGHRQTVEPELIVPTSLPSVGPAGSIFSSERVIIPAPVERPATDILTPGLRQRKPTPPRSANTFGIEASDPEELYQTHAVFRDPEYVKFASSGDSSPRDIFSKDADCFNLRYFPEFDRNGNFNQFNEITTSYSDSLKDLPPMGRSQSCLDIVDQMMEGDGGDMVLFGRWRHRKDAPLSQVKLMIEQELRGPGACSLYGPGGLEISDHPLVCRYNERVEKLQEEKIGNSQEPNIPLLSPILIQGSSAFQRSSLRSSTPVTFSMNKDGTFQTTGFQMRTASTGSTVESISPTESSELATQSAQKDTRRDSGVHILQPETFSEKVPDRTGHPSLGNYDVLRYYSPDPALDYKALNDETAPEYNREHHPRVTRDYIEQFCGGFGRPAAPARGPQQQRPRAQNPSNLAHQGTLKCQGPQAPYNRNARHHAMLGYELKRSQKRYGQQEQRDFTAHQQVLPNQAFEVKQQKHVRLDETKNVSYVIPSSQDRKITLFATEDAENAVFSDDEDAALDTKEACNNNKNNNDATNPSQPGSLSSRTLLNKRSMSNASPGAHRTMPMPRSILKTSSSYAAASNSSSAASASAKETAGLNTSTELTPLHATPGTTASSGHESQIKSPGFARSITCTLDERLKQIKQIETYTSYKTVISL